MQRTSLLSRLAILNWLIWLALVGLLAAMVFVLAGHPHFLPVVSLLAALPLAWIALVLIAVTRAIRGPERRRAMGWLLLGSAPMLVFAGHIMFGLRGGYGRTFTMNYPVLLLIPLGESIMDLEARVRYPMRTVGEKVVMISPRIDVAAARAQVDAMDAHIRVLEKRLDHQMPGSVHWVRGPLFGMEGRALFALCLGSKIEESTREPSVLTSLDRHEVAHCVITLMGTHNQSPPALLGEGWAESCGGASEDELIGRMADLRDEGRALSLRELTSGDWYGRHQWPVYCEGAPLVNLLLKTYGSERFFELYTTSKKATFADDFKRILGVDLDQVDADLNAQIDAQLSRRGRLGTQLAAIKTASEVNQDAWQKFVDEYIAATKPLLQPYNNARIEAERVYVTREEGKEPNRVVEHYELHRNGPRALLKIDRTGVDETMLATPKESFRLNRADGGQSWEKTDYSDLSPDRARLVVLNAIEGREPARNAATPLFDLAETISGVIDASSFRVKTLERFTVGTQHRLRVRIEDTKPGVPVFFRAAEFVLDVDDHLKAIEAEYEDREETKGTITFEYDRINDIPMIRSTHGVFPRSKGRTTDTRLNVLKRDFTPIGDDAFDADRLAAGPYVVKKADPYSDTAWQVSLADFFWAPLAAAGACLATGLILLRSPIAAV